MSNIYGKNIKVSVFGQSHSEAIGVTVEGLPSGFAVDFEELSAFMQRRAPGQGIHSTKRKEADKLEFLSGIADGVTCGAAITAIIRNTDIRSSDYKELWDIPRPAHADYTSYIKYGKHRDVRGGGEFSGRLTAPICAAGGMCLQLLRRKGIEVSAEIVQIGKCKGSKEDMFAEIEKARQDGDSVGGIIECTVKGVPPGIGEPMFDGMENRIASIIFGIPAVKGIEFGNGFACTELRGSQNNDAFIMDVNTVKTDTNNHGGILGGITSGMPIVFRAAIKPTPSISVEQKSVSLSKGESASLVIKGRHDPCIVPRAVPCVEAAAAIAVYDAMLDPVRKIDS